MSAVYTQHSHHPWRQDRLNFNHSKNLRNRVQKIAIVRTMPTPTRIQIAKPDIVRLFEAAAVRIYSRADIERILAENRRYWRLATATTVNAFLDFMINHTELHAVRVNFPSRPVSRYTWGELPIFEVVQSFKKEGYFTHYTAMHLHGLTDQIPKTIYLNFEQPAAGGGGQLSQARIDQAFKRKCRVSNNVATCGDRKICLLNGRNTGQLGVIDLETTEGSRLRVTNIERTLVDATVRPVYSGGVFEVSRAFRTACGQLSVNRLVATLRKLNFTYPYHQAIGFYLEHAGGYRQPQIELLRGFDFEYDFYLAHEMKDPDYNEKWRLFVPKGF